MLDERNKRLGCWRGICAAHVGRGTIQTIALQIGISPDHLIDRFSNFRDHVWLIERPGRIQIIDTSNECHIRSTKPEQSITVEKMRSAIGEGCLKSEGLNLKVSNAQGQKRPDDLRIWREKEEDRLVAVMLYRRR